MEKLAFERATLEEVIRFNEAGVCLYDKGFGEDAYNMFCLAGRTLLHAHFLPHVDVDLASCLVLAQDHGVPQQQEGQYQENSSTVPLDWNCCLHTLEKFSSTPHNWEHSNPSSSCGERSTALNRMNLLLDTEAPYMYNEVFSLRDIISICHYLEEAPSAIAKAVVLYNMALVLHRGQVSYSRQSLERALVFYCFAGHSLWDSLGCSIEQDPVTCRLYCAILNNAGYLLHQIGTFDWSRLFFLRLYEFLGSLHPARTCEEKQERQYFQLNVVLFYRDFTAAPAA